jgi:hypothetical protein
MSYKIHKAPHSSFQAISFWGCASMIGKTLAHYKITNQTGRGAMGEVYQAKDQKLGRDLAIKVLPGACKRFLQYEQILMVSREGIEPSTY